MPSNDISTSHVLELPFRRLLLAWLLMLVLMVANGTARELVIEKYASPRLAGVISAAVGITLLQFVAWRTLRPLRTSLAQRSAIAGLWVVLTVAFEFAFGHYVDGATWQELVADYNLLRGRLWPLIVVSIATAPFIWTRR